MKWVVVLLLAVNILVWLGADPWAPPRTQAVVVAKTLPRVATLKVDAGRRKTAPENSKSSPSAGLSDLVAESAAVGINTSSGNSGQVCIRLGWFDSRGMALEAYGSMGSPGDLVVISGHQRTLDPLHWVIIPPQSEGRARALFNELQRRGIDSYLVTRGENANAISLGLFQSEEAARRILNAKKRQNLNAILAKFPRNQLSYSLVFQASRVSDSEAARERLEDYRNDFDLAEISGCESIATTPENP